ncbi:MAG: DUF1761 domain-containing protein [Gammaproteobacteria bacterium]|nr:DUF1761 domain-containing protein [Gammaproteobacteria bacterium]
MAEFDLIAIIIAAAAGFAVGGLWYAPFLFGPFWSRYNPMEADQEGRSGAPQYAVAIAGTLVQALVLYFLLVATDSLSPAPALWIGFLLWAGFTAAPSLAEAIFSRRSLGAWLVDSSHRLLVTLVMALVLAFMG